MKILVIGAMHGNEPLGIELVRLLKANSLKNVNAIVANQRALEMNVRFIDNDLNRSFPGNGRSQVYEERRASAILELTRSYDLVLDFHNTNCPNNDCSFVGQGANEQIFAISSWLGLSRVIVADYACINKYALNCLSIEVSLASQLNNHQVWYERIKKLSQLGELSSSNDVQKYRFVHRMTLEDRDKFDLPSKNLKAFQALGSELAEAMNVKSPAYPIFIGDGYTPYNYGGLLNKLDKV